MPKHEFRTFRSLLNGAICTRSQAQFARDAGLSAVHLNRMLNNNLIERPRDATLHRIASVAMNGITYQDLKDALDKDDPDYKEPTFSDMKLKEAQKDFAPSFEDVTKETFLQLSQAMDRTTEKPIVTESLSDCIQRMIYAAKTPDALEVSFEICKEHPYCGHFVKDVQYWCSVLLSTAGKYGKTGRSEAIMYYSKVGNYIVLQKATMQIDYIFDLWGMPAGVYDQEDDEIIDSFKEALSKPYYVVFEDRLEVREELSDSAKQRLLNAIFRKREAVYYPIFGFGFTLNDVPSNFVSFVKKHLKTILNQYESKPNTYLDVKENILKLLEQSDAEALAKYFDEIEYDDVNSLFTGWRAVVSEVMTDETSFEFMYFANDEDDFEEFPDLDRNHLICIQNEYIFRSQIDLQTIIDITAKYVSELGLKKFGDILFMTIREIEHKRTFTIKDQGDPEEADYVPVQLHWVKCEDTLPKKVGAYMVKLKDGRQMRCAFITSTSDEVANPLWLLRHKCWNDDVVEWAEMPKEEKED